MAYQAEQAEKYSLRVQVYYKLRDNILNGVYEEGMLLQEIKISEEFGVSRTPVREALKQLELEGLILMIPNKGARVLSISTEDIKDIYEIRSLIEGMAARLAAEKITDEELKKMEETLDLEEFFIMKNNIEGTTGEDSSFHQIMYSSCHSRYLEHILTDFHRYCQMARSKSLASKGRSPKSLEEHRAIFEALKAHDGDRAAECATRHVLNSKENLLKYLE